MRLLALMIDSGLGAVPQEQKMLKAHLARVIYHQVYQSTKKDAWRPKALF